MPPARAIRRSCATNVQASSGAQASAAVNAIDDVKWLREETGKTFYAVGGAWRSFARLHMEQAGYPLHIIHHYDIAADEARAQDEVGDRRHGEQCPRRDAGGEFLLVQQDRTEDDGDEDASCNQTYQTPHRRLMEDPSFRTGHLGSRPAPGCRSAWRRAASRALHRTVARPP